MIEICNLRNEKPKYRFDVRVDGMSVLGNPFFMKKEDQRDAVCDRYEDHFNVMIRSDCKFQRELARIQSIYETYGKLRLFCWCAPKRCHAETIKRWLEKSIQ